MNASLLLALVALQSLNAQSPAPRPGSVVPPAVLVENVRVEDGDGSVQEGVNVVLQNGRLAAVGKGAVAPAGAVRVDGRGKVVTPGLVAVPSQVGLVEVVMEENTDDSHTAEQAAPAFRAADGFNPLSSHLPVDRAQGVLHAVLAPRGRLLFGQAFAVDLSGRLDALPDVSRPVAMWAAFGEGGAEAAGGARGGALLRLRQIVDDVRFFQQNQAAYDRAGARELSLSRLDLLAMIPVVEGRLPLVVRAHRASDIAALVAWAKAEKLRLVIDGGAEAWLVKELLAEARVPVLVKPSEGGPYAFESLYARDDNATLLAQAGVPLVFSAQGATDGTTRLRQEAGHAVSHGLPRADALKAIMGTPAQVFGVVGGRLVVGQPASLVVWSGDPLEVSSFAERAWIGGAEVSLQTRHDALARRYAPKGTAPKAPTPRKR